MQLGEVHISPLIKRLNYLIVSLSFISMVSTQANDLLAFKPSSILWAQQMSSSNSTHLQENPYSKVPYLWTFSTSVLVESSFVFLALHLLLINYIVMKNRGSLERVWSPKYFLLMLLVSSFLATCTHFAFRLFILEVFKNT